MACTLSTTDALAVIVALENDAANSDDLVQTITKGETPCAGSVAQRLEARAKRLREIAADLREQVGL